MYPTTKCSKYACHAGRSRTLNSTPESVSVASERLSVSAKYRCQELRKSLHERVDLGVLDEILQRTVYERPAGRFRPELE
jgi:hypothetical protein